MYVVSEIIDLADDFITLLSLDDYSKGNYRLQAAESYWSYIRNEKYSQYIVLKPPGRKSNKANHKNNIAAARLSIFDNMA